MMSYARGTKPKVLMLGWEYPPRFAGGLGKACQGFSEALARQGADVLFVLPTFQTPIREESLQVIGADSAPESLAAAGTSASAGRGLTLPSGLSFLSANKTHAHRRSQLSGSCRAQPPDGAAAERASLFGAGSGSHRCAD